MKNKVIGTAIIAIIFFIGCNTSTQINIAPHTVSPHADIYYQQAISLLEHYDPDSTRKCLDFLNKALEIDSLNPDYYGVKAKLHAELGLLDSALIIQRHADEIGAINGEYLFQLGLFQAAKGFPDAAKENFRRSNEYLKVVLKRYPDSLGAFITQQAANSLYVGNDSLFMNDLQNIRKQFSNRLMDIEMARRVKPSSLIIQLQRIEESSFHELASSLDSLLNSSSE